MKVTNPGVEQKSARRKTSPGRVFRLLGVAIGGFALLMLIVVLSQPSRLQRAVAALESRWGGDFYAYDRSLAEKWSIAVGSFLRGSTDGVPEVPELIIDIPFKGMSKIYAKRDEALKIGNLIQGPDDFVNGEIRFEDRVLPIKLRLKGDWNDHLGGRKWSFRVHVRSGEQIFGMRKFSIQSPATRGFQTELLYFDVLRRFGVMTPRYFFVEVTLNGDSMGLMAVEEFFAKELVEFNRRREGVIVRFDESLVWRAKDSLTGESVGWAGAFDHHSNTMIDGIGSGKIAESPVLSKQYRVAVGLLRAFVDGDLPASEVFDARQMGRFLAVTDMFGAWHAARWPNLRFYLNPVTLRLEPIAFDASLTKPLSGARSILNQESLLTDIMEDPALVEVYKNTLVELEAMVASGELEATLRDVEARPLRTLQTEYRMLGNMPLDNLGPRVEALLAKLDNNNGNPPNYLTWEGEGRAYPIMVHVASYTENGQEMLELTNAIPKDVEVIGVERVNLESGTRTRIDMAGFPLKLEPRGIGSAPVRHVFEMPDVELAQGEQIQVAVRLDRRPWFQSMIPVPTHPSLDASPVPDDSVASQLQQHEFLQLGEAGDQLTIKPGSWTVAATLIVPAGYRLQINPGTQLRFAPQAALISHGPVQIRGTATAPVELAASTDAGWLGMVVMEAGGKSTLEYTIVRDTTSVVTSGWTLTGGVNFYASNVEILNSRLLDSRGEDALNIIQSEFVLRDTEIRGTASDAFDADFSSGTVEGGLFADVGKAGGGDAIDVSGSDVVVIGTRFENISDKALSVGEASRMDAQTVIVNGTGTGAAAKDGSTLTLSESVIDGASFAGLTAYIKKPEYGPARIEARDVSIVGAETPALAQTGSVVSIDGSETETRDVDVDALYETIMKPGLRK